MTAPIKHRLARDAILKRDLRCYACGEPRSKKLGDAIVSNVLGGGRLKGFVHMGCAPGRLRRWLDFIADDIAGIRREP
jgi:hypothetical protein